MKTPLNFYQLLITPVLVCAAIGAQAQTRADLPAYSQAVRDQIGKKLESLDRGDTQSIHIRSLTTDELDRAIEPLQGSISVDFGNGQEIEFQKDAEALSAGVNIGSGADGKTFVARSSGSVQAPVVLQPPIVAEMSITVVGGKDKYCVFRLLTDESGSLVPYEIGAKNTVICANRGSTIDLLQPGTYAVGINDTKKGINSFPHDNAFVLGSYMFVKIERGEHKVIPLRQVIVPAMTSVKGCLAFF